MWRKFFPWMTSSSLETSLAMTASQQPPLSLPPPPPRHLPLPWIAHLNKVIKWIFKNDKSDKTSSFVLKMLILNIFSNCLFTKRVKRVSDKQSLLWSYIFDRFYSSQLTVTRKQFLFHLCKCIKWRKKVISVRLEPTFVFTLVLK